MATLTTSKKETPLKGTLSTSWEEHHGHCITYKVFVPLSKAQEIFESTNELMRTKSLPNAAKAGNDVPDFSIILSKNPNQKDIEFRIEARRYSTNKQEEAICSYLKEIASEMEAKYPTHDILSSYLRQ